MTAGTLGAVDVIGAREREVAWREALSPRRTSSWDLERFAEEQIRGLVRRVFSLHGTPPIRQVVFSPIDSSSDVHPLCRQVGDLLSREKGADVAIVGAFPHQARDASTEATDLNPRDRVRTPLKQVATRLHRNCWLLDSGNRLCQPGESLQSYLSQIREEFEYSILAAPAAGESDTATAIAQLADGIILVLQAQSTRRAVAQRIKERMDDARVRLLGTVLSDREFPIPRELYLRL